MTGSHSSEHALSLFELTPTGGGNSTEHTFILGEGILLVPKIKSFFG